MEEAGVAGGAPQRPGGPLVTGTDAPHSSTVKRALRLAWASGTLPATTVMATTSKAGSRRAITSATASSEAVSVSISSGVGNFQIFSRVRQDFSATAAYRVGQLVPNAVPTKDHGG